LEEVAELFPVMLAAGYVMEHDVATPRATPSPSGRTWGFTRAAILRRVSSVDVALRPARRSRIEASRGLSLRHAGWWVAYRAIHLALARSSSAGCGGRAE